MKIIPIGRGGVFEIWSDYSWSNGAKMVVGNDEWDQIEVWCRKARIYYAKSGNRIEFFKDKDATAFMLRWG